MTNVTTKILDAKGRVTLGTKYAGQTVVIDDSNPGCIIIKPMVMIPAEEAWLYENKEARNLLRQGLKDATDRNFTEATPDVDGDLAWLGDVED